MQEHRVAVHAIVNYEKIRLKKQKDSEKTDKGKRGKNEGEDAYMKCRSLTPFARSGGNGGQNVNNEEK